MELKNIKHEEIERVEVNYGRIQKLAHGLQVPTTIYFLTPMFRAGLQSYLKIATTKMKQSTLQQHKEALGSQVKASTKEKKEKENVLTDLEFVNKNNIFLLQFEELRKKTANEKKEKVVRGTKGI